MGSEGPKGIWGADLPEEPTPPLVQDAFGLHEMFKALRAAGFSQWEACVIIGTAIASHANNPEEQQ